MRQTTIDDFCSTEIDCTYETKDGQGELRDDSYFEKLDKFIDASYKCCPYCGSTKLYPFTVRKSGIFTIEKVICAECNTAFTEWKIDGELGTIEDYAGNMVSINTAL